VEGNDTGQRAEARLDDTNPEPEEPPTPTEAEARAAGQESQSMTQRLLSQYFPRTQENTPQAREAYVAREVAITKAQMETNRLKEALDADGHTRLQRSETYARWRWDAYWRDEVASL
jgi:hypothetical protein